MTYYFDALPLHPGPEYLESLTSYLMRLAGHNGIVSVDGISALFFPLQNSRITRDIADYPPTSFGELPKAGVCNEEAQRMTTFYHIGAKFGRSTLPQPMSRFLSGCVGQYLRYCPLCFAEQRVRHYLLPWRFLMVTCCNKHKCRLLDLCGHCNELIPLFRSPFILGDCPKCRQKLKLCAALGAGKAELERSLQVYDDIVFFLTPRSWETDSSIIIERLGRRLSSLRRKKQLTAIEVAARIGVTQSIVEGIERGNIQGRGATLQSYFKYANYFRLSLNQVFGDVIDAFDQTFTISPTSCPTCQQSKNVIRVGYNRSGSQRYECHSCHRSFTASPKARKVKGLLS